MKLFVKTTIRLLTTIFFVSVSSLPVFGTQYEQMPSYPGGERALIDYFKNNLQCPKEVIRAKVRGKVDVSFVIMKNGAVENVQVLVTVLLKKSGVLCRDSTLIKLCEQEAVRVCQNMRKWIPARSFDVGFMVKYYMSIWFNDSKKYPCEIFGGEDILDEEYYETFITNVMMPWYQWRDSLGKLSVTEEMKMRYNKPEGFSEDDSEECFKENSRVRSAFKICLSPWLRSDDGQFISFLQFFPIYTEEYEERLNYVFNRRRQRYPTDEMKEKHHRWKMKHILQDFYHVSALYVDSNDPTRILSDPSRARDIGESWRDSIAVLSTEEARSKWNASSAYCFPLHLQPKDYYKKDYKHLKVLLIQREGRGYACIYSFYTDEAKANLDKYWRKVEKMLRFED